MTFTVVLEIYFNIFEFFLSKIDGHMQGLCFSGTYIACCTDLLLFTDIDDFWHHHVFIVRR